VSNDPAGVDLNRNFDIAWDFNKYYSRDAVRRMRAAHSLVVSDDPCNLSQTYHGPPPSGAGTREEPETQNIQELFNSKKVNFYMDVHSSAGNFLFSWGTARNQIKDPAQTFKNPSLDRGSTGTGGRDPIGNPPPYAEWMHPKSERDHQLLGDSMGDSILISTGYLKSAATADPVAAEAHRRSLYPAEQSLGPRGSLKEVSTGASDDYAFSQQIGSSPPPILAKALDPVFSFTFECGRGEDGGFQPNSTTEYPKIEREVGAGLAKFLSFAATWRAPVSGP